MVGTLAVGGTLAWFTDTETATNVVTVGNIDIALNETGDGTVTEGGDGLKYENVMPKDVFEKNVDIENVGSNDAYVRATIKVTGDSKIINDLVSSNENAIKFTELATGGQWSKVDETTAEYIVEYNGALKTEEPGNVWNLFDSVEIPSTWGNEYSDVDFNIVVTAEAIQADNLTQEEAISEMGKIEDLDAGRATDKTGGITNSEVNDTEDSEISE